MLPPDESARDATLLGTGVTLRSTLGAIAYHTGGLLIDHGWLRILGCGHPRLTRTLPAWNAARARGFMLVADDAVGGFFALDGGAFGKNDGAVHYFAPDSLEWEPMKGIGYSAFIAWACEGDIPQFYNSMRWPGWEAEAAALHGDSVIHLWPPLYTKEGADPSKVHRGIVPVAEAFLLHVGELTEGPSQ